MLSLYGLLHLHSTVMLQIHEYNISLKLGLQKKNKPTIKTELGIGVIIRKVCQSLQCATFLNGASASSM